MARSATALHRLLDVLPVFAGDSRIDRLFTLMPGSDFGIDALAAVDQAGAHTLPWDEALGRAFDLIVAASPKGELRLLHGARVLLPHGAGFGKTVRDEGSADSASGLDPAYLLAGDRALVTLHALAHPDQVAQLAARSPRAAARAKVVGDPTLERVLASRSHRDRYRAALGTGTRTLIVLASTWGRESLLHRRPTLPAVLAAGLPYDAYQLALIVHPNEHSKQGHLNLTERFAPALATGAVLARPYEEWAALLVAADAIVTDHGSTALYGAALDRPVIAAYDGGDELIPDSPIAHLLARSPRLAPLPEPDGSTDEVARAVAAARAGHRPGTARAVAAAAFAEQGRSLERLREELYEVLRLAPRAAPATARVLPEPRPPARPPAAFAVRAHIEGQQVRIERYPADGNQHGHFLAAEHDLASEPQNQSAALLYRRHTPAAPASTINPASPASPAGASAPTSTNAPAGGVRPAAVAHGVAWTAAGWTEHALADYPWARTAAVVLSASRCVVRTDTGHLLAVRLSPRRTGGRVAVADPAAALCAVHAWLAAGHPTPATLACVIGGHTFIAQLQPATPDEAAQTF
ncbi:translation initiation factor 2 [Streptomyces sp. HSW2009]|uniref:translation initiation factor 2 n=1 Tax=Streptomyces sp. HSW2009 TaxID=3142890 RepID=UPI0032F0164E